MLDPSTMSPASLIARLVRTAPRYRAVVLNGSIHAEQLAAIALRRVHPAVPLVLSDCTWKVGRTRTEQSALRAGIRLMDGRRTNYCVLSSAERDSFPHLWRVDARRVHFTHWCHDLTSEELEAPVSDEPFVFAGGDSMRDYAALVEAARQLDHPVFIATRTRPGIPDDVPSNVTVREVSKEEYLDLMRRASVVVVALKGATERSAGQANYLDAMAMGKCVIVTDGTGVRDYVEPGKTALIVPPDDPTALTDAVRWALDPGHASETRKMRDEARSVARSRFGPDQYVKTLLAVVDAVTG